MKTLAKSATLCSLFLFSFLVYSQEKQIDSVKAVVGDIPILVSEIEEIEKEFKKTPAMLDAYRLDKNYTKEQLLERLIEDAIIKQKVKEIGIEITPADVESQISQIAKQYGISKAQLETSLKKEGIDPQAYRKNIRTQLERRDFFDRTLRRGGGVSDAELRQLYERNAPMSFHIFLLSNSTGAQNDKFLVSVREEILSKKTSLSDAVKKYSPVDQGWISEEDLEKSVLDAIKISGKSSVVGPIKMGTSMRLVFILGEKKGTDEDFEKTKPSLMAKAQAEDFERRLGFWMEAQKRELQIIRN